MLGRQIDVGMTALYIYPYSVLFDQCNAMVTQAHRDG